MKKKSGHKIFLLGLMPLIFGTAIYIIFRTDTILVFDWLKNLGLENFIIEIRSLFSNVNLEDWIKYNLPDLLWIFGFTSVMVILWTDIKSKFKLIYIFAPLFLSVVSELMQYFNPNLGTFDKLDLIFYVIGSLTSILILTFINPNKNEKQNYAHFQYFSNRNFHFRSNWLK